MNIFDWIKAKLLGKASSISATKEERVYRGPRVELHPLINVFFKRADWAGKPPHLLANFSRNGVGVIRNAMDEWPGLGETVDGHLLINGTEHALSFAIAHVAKGVIGGKVIGDATLALREIAKAFPVEVAAAQMTEVNPKILKPEGEGTPRLFRNPESCELFLIADGPRVKRFELSFFGNYIEGSESARTKVGFLWNDEPAAKPQHKGSSTVRLSSRLSPETIEIALRLIAMVPGLENAHRQWIRETISELRE